MSATDDNQNKSPEPEFTRKRLPDERRSITHKFNIAGYEGYITAGMYADGALGEIFIFMAKQGSTISGLMDSFATCASIALQYGVPLEVLANKFTHTRFEPAGITCNPEIPMAKSVMDYIFRWLALRFVSGGRDVTSTPEVVQEAESDNGFVEDVDAPPCSNCGTIMTRSGTCHRCLNCGSTSGCS